VSVCSELIGDYVERITTWSPAKSNVAAFRYIDLGSVSQEEKSIVGASVLPTSEAPSRARQIVEAGDVLVSTVRPNLNGVAYVPPEFDGCTASTGFCVLRPREGRLSGRYLYHWVRSSAFVKDMVSKSTGASYPAVSDKIVKASSIPLPPLYEQRRIAAILDKADSLRQKRKQAIALLESLTEAIFLEMFGDPVSNPKGFPTVSLGELFKVSSGNGLTSKEMDQSGEYPVYGGNGISGHHSEYMFEDPQLVIGRVGVYCGAVHFTEPQAWVTDNALYVREYKNAINVRFLEWSLRLANLNQYAGRAAQPLISGSRIYPVEILLPDEFKQTEFAKTVEQKERLLGQLTTAIKNAETLFASLQHRAFAGEL
jgi:type I restriction enzyme S subunit